MAGDRLWTALVTFERGADVLGLLPDYAQGAVGRMLAFARGPAMARRLFVRDLEACGLRVIEVDQLQEVEGAEVKEIDDHLAENLLNLEPGQKTVWGNLHTYVGEGEAFLLSQQIRSWIGRKAPRAGGLGRSGPSRRLERGRRRRVPRPAKA